MFFKVEVDVPERTKITMELIPHASDEGDIHIEGWLFTEIQKRRGENLETLYDKAKSVRDLYDSHITDQKASTEDIITAVKDMAHLIDDPKFNGHEETLNIANAKHIRLDGRDS